MCACLRATVLVDAAEVHAAVQVALLAGQLPVHNARHTDVHEAGRQVEAGEGH
jgi:hypothetical protein